MNADKDAADPRRADSEVHKAVTEKNASAILRIKQKPKDLLEEIAEDELKVLHHDLSTAAQMQAKLLPERLPKIAGYDFSAYYSPAGELSGDFYDFIQFDKDHLGVVIADASGKGLSGSLLMVEARAVIRSMASLSVSPAEVLRRANRVLCQDLKKGMFITVFYAVLSLSKGRLHVSSAGHTPMLLWRWKTRKCYVVNPSGLVLGAATEEMFNQTVKEQAVQLEPGDRFVLYTDGVTELMDYQDKEFGNGRFVGCTIEHAPRTSDEYIAKVVGALEAHRSGFAQSDDITIVTGRMAAEEEMWGGA